MNISYTACKVDVSDSVKLQSDQEKERKGVKEKRELKQTRIMGESQKMLCMEVNYKRKMSDGMFQFIAEVEGELT